MKLSACLIVKDEEATLARCLNCIKHIADEIVVVDTGSTDKTVKIARRFTQKVYFFEWIDDFSAARNYSLKMASGDYLLWLDADDVITKSNAKKIRKLVDEGGFDMAFLKYACAFEGGKPTFLYMRERIIKRGKFQFEGEVHEAIAPSGKIVYSSARIDHKKEGNSNPLRNLSIYQNMISRGKPLGERALFYYGRELMFNNMYAESAAVLKLFLERGGWVENEIEACLNLCRIYFALGKEDEGYLWLLKSFTLGKPTSEACCILGDKFFLSDPETAIYWYKRALTATPRLKEGGFVNLNYSVYIPCLQLCVLYDRLGDRKKAKFFNEKAGRVKPKSREYLLNKSYFKTIDEVNK